MNRNFGRGGLCAAGAALLVFTALLVGASAPSAASAYTLAYTGTVTSADGVFQALGAAPGDSVSGTITIDPFNESVSSTTPLFTAYSEAIAFTFHLTPSSGPVLNLADSSTDGAIGSVANSGTDIILFQAFNPIDRLQLEFLSNGALASLTSLAGLPSSPSALIAMLGGDAPTATGFFSLNGFGEVDFNIALTATPIPATLPLFVSALGGLGFMSWRRRKASTDALSA